MTAMTTAQIAERSEALFRQGFCCAESVLQAVAESRGIQSELIPRIATGLCGGIGRSGGICGAVSGGVLGINVVAGRSQPSQSPDANHRMVRALLSSGICTAMYARRHRMLSMRSVTASFQLPSTHVARRPRSSLQYGRSRTPRKSSGPNGIGVARQWPQQPEFLAP